MYPIMISASIISLTWYFFNLRLKNQTSVRISSCIDDGLTDANLSDTHATELDATNAFSRELSLSWRDPAYTYIYQCPLPT